MRSVPNSFIATAEAIIYCGATPTFVDVDPRTYTMDPKKAALAARLLGVKKVIPIHFGTFPILSGTPAELAALVKADAVEVWELQPGTPVRW